MSRTKPVELIISGVILPGVSRRFARFQAFDLCAPKRITWRQVYRQFGVNPSKATDRVTVRNFQRKLIRELKKIKIAWPELNYTTAPAS